MTDDLDNLGSTRTASWMALLLSSSTLICCALPALFVALGAGAALSTLIAEVPQLVWFSEQKLGVFLVAGVMLTLSGILQCRSRRLPCPADPALGRVCARLRTQSLRVYLFSVVVYATGGFFAFVAPYLLA